MTQAQWEERLKQAAAMGIATYATADGKTHPNPYYVPKPNTPPKAGAGTTEAKSQGIISYNADGTANYQGGGTAGGTAGGGTAGGITQAQIQAYNTALTNAQKLGQESNERARAAFATQNELAKQQNAQNLEVAKQATQSSATSSTGGGSTKATAVTGVGNQGVGAAAFQTMRAANQNEFNSGANKFTIPNTQKIFFGGT